MARNRKRRTADKKRLALPVVRLRSLASLVAVFPTEATAEETRDLIDGLEAQGIKVRYDREAERNRTQARIRGEAALLTREQEVALARQIRDGHRRRHPVGRDRGAGPADPRDHALRRVRANLTGGGGGRHG